MDQKLFNFRNLKTTPSKLRMAINLIKNKSLTDAYNILGLTINKSAQVLKKNLKAAENSVADWQLPSDKIFIRNIASNEGIKLKRSIPRSRGRVSPFKIRMSNLKLTLSKK